MTEVRQGTIPHVDFKSKVVLEAVRNEVTVIPNGAYALMAWRFEL